MIIADNRGKAIQRASGPWYFLWLLCCKLFMVDETHYFKVAFEMGKEFKLLSHPFLKHEQKRMTSTVRSEIVVKKQKYLEEER